MYYTRRILVVLFSVAITFPVFSQKGGLESITKSDLKMHMDFLASDELAGRATSDKEIQIAAKYLSVQAEHLGLLPAGDERGYMQYYTLNERSYDRENCSISLVKKNGKREINTDSFYALPGIQSDHYSLKAPIVFAGYGIDSPEDNYNDFEGIELAGKIVMIMNRAPMNEDGSECLFGEKWNEMENLRFKMPNIFMKQAALVFLVMDPKSGMNSIEDLNPAIAGYLGKSITLKNEDIQSSSNEPPRMILIHRSLADLILEGSGKTLEGLQEEIDRTLAPQSFDIADSEIELELNMKNMEVRAPNVFGSIEGSDPVLKNEMLLYLAHFDHLGTDDEGGVFNGADDNASGTVALLEIAEAFQKDKKRPKRSIGFLWVSGEEIGLFGSSYFSEHPLVPSDQIVSVINLDMVGRNQTEEDLTSEREDVNIHGGDTIAVIGALQSSVLMEINKKTLSEMGLIADYTYNDIHHPDRFFYRSDHISFARKDIPALFYSTGEHADYHRLTDDPEKIDYPKFQKVTRFSYKVGFNLANYKGEIIVDKPMSEW